LLLKVLTVAAWQASLDFCSRAGGGMGHWAESRATWAKGMGVWSSEGWELGTWMALHICAWG